MDEIHTLTQPIERYNYISPKLNKTQIYFEVYSTYILRRKYWASSMEEMTKLFMTVRQKAYLVAQVFIEDF